MMDGLVDFLAVESPFSRHLNAESDFVAANVNDSHFDQLAAWRTENDGFISFP